MKSKTEKLTGSIRQIVNSQNVTCKFDSQLEKNVLVEFPLMLNSDFFYENIR